MPKAEAADADDSAPLPAAEVDAEDLSVRAQAVRDDSPGEPPGFARRLIERTRRAASFASVVAVLAGSVIGGREAHRWITTTSRFGAREIEVTGVSRTLRDEVLTAAHVQMGTNVLGLDTVRAEHAIAELPWIERAHVTRRLPGFVHIEVEERTAAAVVSAGGLYLSSADGVLFKRVQAGDPDDLPMITGIRRQDFETDSEAARENVRDALALLADLAASALNGRVHVEEVHREPTGDLSLVTREGGVYVWLGRGPYRAKMARLSAILAELEREHIAAAEIHLESDRHPERATVRVQVPDEPVPAPTHAAPVADARVASINARLSAAARGGIPARNDSPTRTPSARHRDRH